MKKTAELKMWEKLLDDGFGEAAAGLLLDLFRWLEYAEDHWPSGQGQGTQFEETNKWMREHRRAKLREVLMQILVEDDGHPLENWWELYRNDRTAFCDRARQFARARNSIHQSGLWLDEDEEQVQ